MYEVPASLVDTSMLPPPLMTSEPGSFAHNTFKVRVPRIIDDIVAANAFPQDILAGMRNLRDEITGGRIRALLEDTPDAAFWDRVSAPWLGRTWLEVPWYWAEAYIYRRVLEATHYFQPGAWCYVDPYMPQKNAELAPSAAPKALSVILNVAPEDKWERFEALVYASLWGNRTDLSYNVATSLGASSRQTHEDERANVLVDDAERLWERLSSRACRAAAVITDNAGTELCMDLALVDHLLSSHLVDRVDLHLKPQPFYISDAMPKDVLATIQVLLTLADDNKGGEDVLTALGRRLAEYQENKQLRLTSHWMYTSSLFYFQMPEDLYDELETYDLVILKGDANYRRLLGDAHWEPTASFVDATSYFPTSFVALRTLKAELIAGLPPGMAEQLWQQDPNWRVNGRRGVVQANLRD